MVVLCGDGEESEGGNADDPLLIFAVISVRECPRLTHGNVDITAQNS